MPQPQKGVAYEFFISLTDIFDPVFFINNPTIGATDFKVSIDGGAFANLTTLPVVTPALSNVVKVSLSAIEMLGDKIVVIGKDVLGDQWGDIMVFIDVEEGTTQTVLDLLDGDFEVTKTRSITRKKGTATIIRDKDVSGSRLSLNDTIRTTEHI